MKLKISFTKILLILFVFFMLIILTALRIAPSLPDNNMLALNILASPVREAIKASQGTVNVSFSTFTGDAYEFLMAGGVLVIDSAHALTVGHVAKYPAIAASRSTNVSFNGVSARFVSTSPDADLALLELEYPIPSMKPAEVAELAEFGKTYTGAVFYKDLALALKMELIGVSGLMFYFDKPSQPGMSGTPLWNNNGKIVSMINSTTPVFSKGARIEAIHELLNRVRREIEENKNKQSSSRKDETPMPQF